MICSAAQVLVLKRCFDGFADEGGAIPADNVGSILSMMGMKVKPSAVREIIEEIDIDGSGLLEFGEFCLLASNFERKLLQLCVSTSAGGCRGV